MKEINSEMNDIEEKKMKEKNKNGEAAFKSKDKYTEIPTFLRTKRSLLGASLYLSASTSESKFSIKIETATKTMKC